MVATFPKTTGVSCPQLDSQNVASSLFRCSQQSQSFRSCPRPLVPGARIGTPHKCQLVRATLGGDHALGSNRPSSVASVPAGFSTGSIISMNHRLCQLKFSMSSFAKCMSGRRASRRGRKLRAKTASEISPKAVIRIGAERRGFVELVWQTRRCVDWLPIHSPNGWRHLENGLPKARIP